MYTPKSLMRFLTTFATPPSPGHLAPAACPRGIKSPISLLMVGVLLLLVRTPRAGAGVATFDDVTTGELATIPDGYHGFDWDSFGALAGARQHPGSGYENGAVSGEYVAFNQYAEVATASDGTFDFSGAYLTAAWNNGLSIQVDGYMAGSPTRTRTVVVDTTGPTWFQFDFLGIDELKFASSGGINAGLGGSGKHFAMDNFTYSGATPPPPPPPPPVPITLNYNATAHAQTDAWGWGMMTWGTGPDDDVDNTVNGPAQANANSDAMTEDEFWEEDPETGEPFPILMPMGDISVNAAARAEGAEQPSGATLSSLVGIDVWGWGMCDGFAAADTSVEATVEIGTSAQFPEGAAGLTLDVEAIIGGLPQTPWSLSIVSTDPANPIDIILDDGAPQADVQVLAGQALIASLTHSLDVGWDMVDFIAGTYDSDIQIKFTVTPEPATMTLLALGGLAVLRRRRRRQAKMLSTQTPQAVATNRHT